VSTRCARSQENTIQKKGGKRDAHLSPDDIDNIMVGVAIKERPVHVRKDEKDREALAKMHQGPTKRLPEAKTRPAAVEVGKPAVKDAFGTEHTA